MNLVLGPGYCQSRVGVLVGVEGDDPCREWREGVRLAMATEASSPQGGWKAAKRARSLGSSGLCFDGSCCYSPAAPDVTRYPPPALPLRTFGLFASKWGKGSSHSSLHEHLDEPSPMQAMAILLYAYSMRTSHYLGASAMEYSPKIRSPVNQLFVAYEQREVENTSCSRWSSTTLTS